MIAPQIKRGGVYKLSYPEQSGPNTLYSLNGLHAQPSLPPLSTQLTLKSKQSETRTMVLLPAFRSLFLNHICRAASSSSSRSTTAMISSLFPFYISIPNSYKLSLLFSSTPTPKTLTKPHLTPQGPPPPPVSLFFHIIVPRPD